MSPLLLCQQGGYVTSVCESCAHLFLLRQYDCPSQRSTTDASELLVPLVIATAGA